jgi:hypothetical protein
MRGNVVYWRRAKGLCPTTGGDEAVNRDIKALLRRKKPSWLSA